MRRDVEEPHGLGADESAGTSNKNAHGENLAAGVRLEISASVGVVFETAVG